jgi:glyoxylase-like metal-dependent hydrolase (beta-lactamase superfamily II)
MFGIVPRVLWERQRTPDESHRIELAMHVLLIEEGGRRTLVDCGAGTKGDEKFRSMYRLDVKPAADWLAPAGIRPDQIDRVLLTHLHFDHAGGCTEDDGAGGRRPAFPRAEYVVQRKELVFADSGNERSRASYRPEDWRPLTEEGRVRLVDGDFDFGPRVRLVPAPGHTPGHQIVLVGVGARTLAFLADLVPTASHLPLAWGMGFDAEPLVAVETKRRVLPMAVREGWWVVFQHDCDIPLGSIQDRNGRLSAEPVATED